MLVASIDSLAWAFFCAFRRAIFSALAQRFSAFSRSRWRFAMVSGPGLLIREDPFVGTSCGLL